jgi:hypothetical protein
MSDQMRAALGVFLGVLFLIAILIGVPIIGLLIESWERGFVR